MKSEVACVETGREPLAIDNNLPVVIDVPAVINPAAAVAEQKKKKLGRPPKNETIPIVEKWLKFLYNRTNIQSEQTERTYRNAIRQMLAYFKANGKDYQQATEQDIIDWRDNLNGKKENKKKEPATVQLYMVATRLFFAFLQHEKIIAENPCVAGGIPLKSKASVKRKPKRSDLAAEQVAAMLEKMPVNSEMELRNKAIVCLMVTSGLRVTEVSEAHCGNMRNEGGYTYLYLRGKGNQEEEADSVKVAPKAEKMIREYWKARFKGRTPKNEDFMFVSTSRNHTADKDEQLSTRTIRTVVKKAMKEIGLDDPQHVAHSLRHTACTLALDAGVAFPDVQMMMRHARPDTTMIYQHKYERKKNNAELAVSNLIFKEGN